MVPVMPHIVGGIKNIAKLKNCANFKCTILFSYFFSSFSICFCTFIQVYVNTL